MSPAVVLLAASVASHCSGSVRSSVNYLNLDLGGFSVFEDCISN